MSNANKVIICAVTLAVTFAVGRFSAPTKIVTQIKTVEVEKKQENVDAKEHEVVVIVKKPDGTQTTTITKNEDTKTQEKDQTNTSTDETKTVERGSSKVTVSALAGTSISNFSGPLYGVLFSKEILGPISVGAFGFNSGLVGVSIGLSF